MFSLDNRKGECFIKEITTTSFLTWAKTNHVHRGYYVVYFGNSIQAAHHELHNLTEIVKLLNLFIVFICSLV